MCQFKMLQSERYANDSDAKHRAQHQMGKANADAADKNPNDIHQNGQTAAIRWRTAYFTAKRHQSYQGKFQSLQPERDTDNRNHKYQARNDVFQKNQQAAQYYPQDIQQNIHTTELKFRCKDKIFGEYGYNWHKIPQQDEKIRLFYLTLPTDSGRNYPNTYLKKEALCLSCSLRT